MLLNIIRTVIIYACRGGRGVQNACCGASCWNCPISRFSTGTTISIFYNKELCIRQQLLGRVEQWVITVPYIIGIVGAVRLWETADPKDQKLCRNCPALPYIEKHVKTWIQGCNMYVHIRHVGHTWSSVEHVYNVCTLKEAGWNIMLFLVLCCPGHPWRPCFLLPCLECILPWKPVVQGRACLCVKLKWRTGDWLVGWTNWSCSCLLFFSIFGHNRRNATSLVESYSPGFDLYCYHLWRKSQTWVVVSIIPRLKLCTSSDRSKPSSISVIYM